VPVGSTLYVRLTLVWGLLIEIRAANEIWFSKELIRSMGFSKFELQPLESFSTQVWTEGEEETQGNSSLRTVGAARMQSVCSVRSGLFRYIFY
jgi:hypothetical protein